MFSSSENDVGTKLFLSMVDLTFPPNKRMPEKYAQSQQYSHKENNKPHQISQKAEKKSYLMCCSTYVTELTDETKKRSKKITVLFHWQNLFF